ncbi:NUDIX hydrolase [Candidatus Nomurabacteria bacterium]|nr:NUDIX hydrolase [Candidatus Nomurabacteria bacterium]
MIEKQPKTSVIVRAVRRNSETGELEHLVCRRLRQPYFGKVGRITGKVRFGETFEEAAARELVEETGLEAGKLTLEEIYRKMRKREDGVFVQDVIFYIFFASELQGELIKKTDTQENLWGTKESILKNCDIYDDLVLDDLADPKKLKFTCSVDFADGF